MIGTEVPASLERQATEAPISAGRRLGRGLGFSAGASREEAPEEMIFSTRDAAPNPSGSGAKRDAVGIIPRRAAEHRTALAENFGSQAPGWTGRKTSEPSGSAVE